MTTASRWWMSSRVEVLIIMVVLHAISKTTAFLLHPPSPPNYYTTTLYSSSSSYNQQQSSKEEPLQQRSRESSGRGPPMVYILRKRELRGYGDYDAPEKEVASPSFEKIVGVYPGEELWLAFALRQAIQNMVFFHSGSSLNHQPESKRVFKDSFGEPLDSALTALFQEEDLPFEPRMERFISGLEHTTDLAQLQSLRQALTMGIVSSVRMGTVRKAAIWDVCASRYYNRAAPEPADEGGTMPLTVEEMKEVIRRGGGLYVNFVKRSTGDTRTLLITDIVDMQDKPGEDGGLLLLVKEKGKPGLRSLYYESIYSMSRVPSV